MARSPPPGKQPPSANRPRRGRFDRQGYLVVPRLVPPALLAYLRSYVDARFAALQLQLGDAQVPGSPAAYADPAFEALLEHVRPRIAELVGRRLHPTYSYFRIYRRGDVLRRHRDRPACEISVSVNVAQSAADAWPLHLDGADQPVAVTLSPGDALVYRGCDVAHWRERFDGEKMVQAFLHYVDADGAHAEERFDRRRTLMLPRHGDAAKAQIAES